jgi:hypothetical protein
MEILLISDMRPRDKPIVVSIYDVQVSALPSTFLLYVIAHLLQVIIFQPFVCSFPLPFILKCCPTHDVVRDEIHIEKPLQVCGLARVVRDVVRQAQSVAEMLGPGRRAAIRYLIV